MAQKLNFNGLLQQTSGLLALCIMVVGTAMCTDPEPSYPPLIPERPRDGGEEPEREKYQGTRDGGCSEDRECKKLCKEIFRSRHARDDCEDHSVADVEKMEKVFEVLEKPRQDTLESMDLEDLRFLLSVGADALEKAAGKMSKTEQKRFLVFLAQNEEAADIVSNAEEEYEILEEFFGTSPSGIIAELKKNIKSGDTFLEMSLEEGNQTALAWIHEFFENDCEDNTEWCVFKKYYCELGAGLNSDSEEEYLDYDFFEDMLDEVLDQYRRTAAPASTPSYCKSSSVPATLAFNCWWNQDTEADDLDRWKSSPNNVCANTCTSLRTTGTTCRK